MTAETDAAPEPLSRQDLFRAADLPDFEDAPDAPAEATPAPEFGFGQSRASEAVALASAVSHPGYNLFVAAPHGAAAKTLVRDMLARKAEEAGAPPDWIYVNNFDDPRRPIALKLPTGRAAAFRDEMGELVEELRAALTAVFESDDYRIKRERIEEEAQDRQEAAFEGLSKSARERGAAIIRTPMGFAVAPFRDGEILPPEAFQSLPAKEQEKAKKIVSEVQDELQALLREMPSFEKRRRAAVRQLQRDAAETVVEQAIGDVVQQMRDLPKVCDYLRKVREALIENASQFLAAPQEEETAEATGARLSGAFESLSVNVIVSPDDGAPAAAIVMEDHPTLQNLVGRIEHVPIQGALVTNFTLIRPGALHRANGGYLLLEARQLFSEPFAWSALKRALRARSIRITPPAEYLGLAATITLEPDPIPLDVKVVIFGDRLHYYLLLALDPEIRELFKVVADFEEQVARSPEAERGLAELLKAIRRRERLAPLTREAAEALIEHAARQADDAAKLSLDIERLSDRLREADHFAAAAGRDRIARADVLRALEGEQRRIGRLRERAQEAILRDVLSIDTQGAVVGRVNALSVSQIGDLRFGRPARVTARARLGGGEVIDIEREVELGGPTHSKGVLILSGFLAARYAIDAPMSLSASLVFEQSYGGVEGDSASCAELCALLSALSEVPLRQELAITGSVNQHGEVKAVGGVNDKIEGFYDICAARGLSGRQGVILPAANAQHLMLRPDVVAACAEGRFAVHAVDHVDQALTLLTGRPAGARGPEGRFPEDSVNGLVEARLERFAEARRAFGAPTRDAGGGDAGGGGA